MALSGPMKVLISVPTSLLFLVLIVRFPGRPWLSPSSCSEHERLSRPPGEFGEDFP